MRIRRKLGAVLLLCVSLATTCWAQTERTKSKQGAAQSSRVPARSQAKSPATPEGRVPVLENGKVRVFRYELVPGESVETPEHQTEHLVIPIGDIGVTVGGRQSLRSKSGEVQILKRGGSERYSNPGTTDAVVIEVEVLGGIDLGYVICGLEGTRCESVLGGDLRGGSWGINTLMKTPGVEIATTEIDPGVTTDGLQRKSPGLRIAISDLEMAEQIEEQEPKLVKESAGTVAWVSAGTPVPLKNMGAEKARFVSIVFP